MKSPGKPSSSRSEVLADSVKDPRPTRKTILLVDDHPMMRAGLAQLIDKQPDIKVGAEADNPFQAMQELSKVQVDLVLTDITMSGRSGIEFIKDLRVTHPDLPILVVSMHDEMLYAERVLKVGARGYVMKEAGGEKLLAAIRQVLLGQVYTSQAVNSKIMENFSAQKPRGSTSPIEKLSDREFDVFQLVGLGKSTRDIAKQLGVSPKTVDVHKSNIRVKLALTDSTSLIRYAVRWTETQDTSS